MDPVKKQFIQIIQQNQGILESICQVYYPCEADRADARQNIILQLWRAFPNFRQEAKISTWVYKVALNTILAQVRNEKRRPRNISLSELIRPPVQLPAADDDVQQLFQIISMLKGKDKAVILLHLEGYSQKEMASILHTSPSNISTRLNRIKNKIKDLYKIHYDEI